MWAPVHGCAIALPRPKKPGIKQHGPKPGRLFELCRRDVQLAWILRVGGCESVLEFALARHELTRCRIEKRQWLSLARSAESLQYQLIQQRVEISAMESPPVAKPLSWEERKRILIARDEKRRQGLRSYSTVVPPAQALGGRVERAPVGSTVGGNGFFNSTAIVDAAVEAVTNAVTNAVVDVIERRRVA